MQCGRSRQGIDVEQMLRAGDRGRREPAAGRQHEPVVGQLDGPAVAADRTRAFRLQFQHLLTTRGAEASAAQHAAVGAAILAGDAESAERLMREHVRLSGDDILGGSL